MDLLAQLAALLRSPLANIASVTLGASKVVQPGTSAMVSRVNGLAAQAQTWAVTIYPRQPQTPDPNTPAGPVLGCNPWTKAFLRWSVGNNWHTATIDVGAGQTLLISFDSLEVHINYFPPSFANAPAVDWGVSVASSFSGMPPALPTQTISGIGNANVPIPLWAQSVTPLCPAAAAPFVVDFTDPIGGVLGSVYGTGIDQQPGPIDLPNGSTFCNITGGANIRWSLVFRLSI